MKNNKIIQIITLVSIIVIIVLMAVYKNNLDRSSIEVSSVSLNNDKPTILVFGSETCSTCISLHNTLESLNKNYNKEININFIDVVKYPDFKDEYEVSSMPTTYFINSDGSPYEISNEVRYKYSFNYKYNEKNNIDAVYLLGDISETDLELIVREMIKK